MAAFGPASMAVPEGFRYETKYVVLSYLGLLPTSRRRAALGSSAEGVESVAEERARLSRMKSEVEDELRRLQEDIAASFSTTGFDTQLSPVFAPADPERSVEDSLAAVGDRVTQDLQPHLDSRTNQNLVYIYETRHTSLHSLTYQTCQARVKFQIFGLKRENFRTGSPSALK
uniref:Uncharacterized protein n=1 Tax=Denticeps clupeoides TaxID=299321 RepID=A0AAY4E7X5_9TELE